MKEVLVVIPARGGSKGIPRKNVRLLAGAPLIGYVIRTSLAARYVTRTVVTTDDEEIAMVAARSGARVIMRPASLAEDAVTLDPVIHHAVTVLEAQGYIPDIVLTVQPTSPLLRPESLEEAISLLVNGGYDTVISAVNDTHLTWRREAVDRYIPNYAARVNRQYLPPVYRETGAILASRRSVVTESSRIGENVTLLEMSREEAIDIDSYFDWWLAEKALTRRRIVLRVDGSETIGLGHVSRCLSLASRLLDHEIIFVMDGSMTLGTTLVEQHHYPLVKASPEQVLETIRDLAPHIVINDILDTSRSYIQALKNLGLFVVNLEDLGEGTEEAHLVINALYDNPHPSAHQIWGPEYDCLRDEFYTVDTKTVRPEVKRILLTFGGVDESNLTIKVLEALEKVSGDFAVDVILGLGYAHQEAFKATLLALKRQPYIQNNVRRISDFIHEADIVVTSAGRTVLEVMAIGTPCVVLAQNAREMSHLHARAAYGVINLGLGEIVPQSAIIHTLQHLIQNHALRQEMSTQMLSLDVRSGCNRVLNMILSRYQTFEEENNGRNSDWQPICRV